MLLGRSESEAEIHKRRADEEPKSGMIDSRSLFSGGVPFNDDREKMKNLCVEDWEKKVNADMTAFVSLFSPPIPHNDGLCEETKPKGANPFLCEGGFGSLSLFSTQVPQKAAGEELGKFTTEMAKPLCEDLSCGICGGAHHHTACDLRNYCPVDQKVGEGFVVICYCGNDLVNGKCRLGCPPSGKAISDKSFYNRPPLFSELFSTKNGLCEETKPKGANPFLCEGGFGSLSLFSTQVPQKAAGEDIGKLKTEMAKP